MLGNLVIAHTRSGLQNDPRPLGQRPRRLMPPAPAFQLLPFSFGQTNLHRVSAHTDKLNIRTLIKSSRY